MRSPGPSEPRLGSKPASSGRARWLAPRRGNRHNGRARPSRRGRSCPSRGHWRKWIKHPETEGEAMARVIIVHSPDGQQVVDKATAMLQPEGTHFEIVYDRPDPEPWEA